MARKGNKVGGAFAYLSNEEKLLNSTCPAKTVDDFLDLDMIERSLITRAAAYVSQTTELFRESKASLNEKNNDLFALDVDRMIKAHMIYQMFLMMRDRMNKWEFKDPNIMPVFQLLLKIFAVKDLLTENQGLYECGYFSRGTGKLLDDSFKKLLVDLRPHMIPLVESCTIIDNCTVSAIGNKWGDIYETQLKFAKTTRLNHPNKPHYYDKWMKPTMNMRKTPPKL